jgi:phenylpropionate dioxygenase-like ring-hydroxylating dioxygenase large terminal subunit
VNYVRNAWYVASWSQVLGDRKLLGVSILDERIVIWRSGTRLTALEDRCVHRLAPLSLGRCEGDNLRCQYHGFLYNADGKVIEVPGQEVVPPGLRAPVCSRRATQLDLGVDGRPGARRRNAHPPGYRPR